MVNSSLKTPKFYLMKHVLYIGAMVWPNSSKVLKFKEKTKKKKIYVHSTELKTSHLGNDLH
jgi:hypothetical protein